MRAREPDLTGTVEVDGQTISYETFGDSGPAIALMPTWCVVHSRAWKMQVPYLANHFRVVTWDGPGNGGSSRPTDPSPFSPAAHVGYALAVLDAAGIEHATIVACSGGTHNALRLAADQPGRVDAAVFVGPFTYLVDEEPGEVLTAFLTGDLGRFLEVFMPNVFSEPHSTKAIEDGIEWGGGTTMEVLLAARVGDHPGEDLAAYRSLCRSIDQPVLVVQGDDDRVTPPAHGHGLAAAIGDNAEVIEIQGGGHRTDIRDPVRFSILLRDFVRSIAREEARPSRWARGTARPARALFLSSSIGLGHVRRDVAIASELRNLEPALEIHWLAQDPVTRVLAGAREAVHPASRMLASESAHFASEADGHALHCFQAWRRMDELLVANFMVLHDVIEHEHYDLIIGDEAWDADHYFHENPELKRGAFAWLTDFVGWLPTDDGLPADSALAADYNAEMTEHIARYPWVRDCSLFVGEPEDIVPLGLGPGLPGIREWAEEHFEFTGYIAAGVEEVDRAALRAELGYAAGERICIATVGGSGVGATLLEAVLAAFPLAKAAEPGLKLLVVAGPRIDPGSIRATHDDVTVAGFVPDLGRRLAVCDLAIVQGGLTTTMELTAAGRPFIYFPLERHCEQQIHVPHRLDRYRAGRRMQLAATTPHDLADAMLEELARRVDYLPVEMGGARRAAERIHALL